MEASFNPYRDWLGIESGQRPGNHYELLGIDLFEGDPSVIAHAADVLTVRIRSVRPGPHVAEWQQLIDAVAGARACLLDPNAKAAYDASLRAPAPDRGAASPPPQRQAPPAPAAPQPPPPATPVPPAWRSPDQPSAPGPPPAPPIAPPIAGTTPGPPSAQPEAASPFPPVRPGSGVASTQRWRRARRKNVSPAQVAVYLITLALLAVAGLFGYLLYQRHQGEPAGSQVVARVDREPSPEDPGAIGQPAPKPRTPVEPGPKPPEEFQPGPKPNTRPKPEAKVGAAVQPKQDMGQSANGKPEPTDQPPQKPIDKELQQTFRQSLAGVRASMSEHDLSAARAHLQSAASEAQTPEEEEEVDRLDAMIGHLDEFWKAMDRAVGKLKAADTVPVDDTFVAIVEATPEELTLKVAGRVRTYPTDDLPAKFIQALADEGFGKDPATRAIVGTYHLVDPDGDKARARQLWTEAVAQGVDIEYLMPELSAWGVSGASQVGQMTAEEAEKAVKERFKEQYAEATGAAGKARLAAELFETGEATTDDPELRFAFFREARDMAIGAGDAELAFQAIERLTGLEVVDVLAMKAEVLVAAAKNARGSGAHKTIVENALQLVEYAIIEEQIDKAKELADLALSAARKSNSRPLMEQANRVVDQVEARQKQGDR